jgi:homogentisate 1,2-dioxygenase
VYGLTRYILTPYPHIRRHGNYVPYKYDLTKFVNVGSISVDHIDPSIFCVMTAPSRDPAAPLADFLIFSPRWDVASHSKLMLKTEHVKDLLMSNSVSTTILPP